LIITYDGFNVASMDGNQTVTGDHIDEVFSSTSSVSSLTPITDGLGSTVAVSDGNGNKVRSYAYGPYGNTSGTGPASAPNQYAGRENDGDTNLYYYRARFYSPTLNRFIAQDPTGLGGGMNTYAYADGDPISNRDPTGLASCGFFDCPTLPQGVVDASAGFGDGVSTVLSLGLYSTAGARAALGIGNEVDMCSASYKAGKYSGYTWGALTWGVAGLNGGTGSVLWHGGAQAAANAGAIGTCNPLTVRTIGE
jgi:RHS repeat-associated protein